MKARIASWSRRRKVAVLLSIAVLIAAGAALAAWLTSGTGNSTAKAGSLAALTISPGPVPAGQLFPGNTGDLSFLVTNPNSGNLLIASVSQAGPTVSSNPGGCPGSNVGLNTGATWGQNIPANASGFQLTIPDGAQMSSSAPDACQGVTFTIPITVNASTP